MTERLDSVEAAERLGLILRTRATGGLPDNEEYRRLRRHVVAMEEFSLPVPKFLKVCRSLDEFWEFIQPKFASYGERRTFLKKEFDPLLEELESRRLGGPTPISQSEVLAEFDSVHVRKAWATALERMKSDPDGAVTAARALLESVCKHVLDQAGVAYAAKDDLPALYSKVAKELTLSPDQQVDETLRRLTGAAQQVVERIGNLRNLISDAHGKGKASPRAEPHQAELAVNLAGSLATYILATADAQEIS